MSQAPETSQPNPGTPSKPANPLPSLVPISKYILIDVIILDISWSF